MLRIIDTVTGVISAPPTPRNARMAMTNSGLLANRTSSDPTPNRKKPASSVRFLPKRSESELVATSKPASTREYTSTIHRS